MSHKIYTRALFLTALAVLALTLTPNLWADDVRNADQLLCASLEATRCSLDGCETQDPVMWNIPQFLEIDHKNKRLQTTAASGMKRATPITTLLREDGHIYIQGIEGGRAFSFVIHEASGELNAAIAASDTATAIFAACTPLPAAD
jgi:hypothetical protein